MGNNNTKGFKKSIGKGVLLDKKVKKVYNWEEQEKILLPVYEELY